MTVEGPSSSYYYNSDKEEIFEEIQVDKNSPIISQELQSSSPIVSSKSTIERHPHAANDSPDSNEPEISWLKKAGHWLYNWGVRCCGSKEARMRLSMENTLQHIDRAPSFQNGGAGPRKNPESCAPFDNDATRTLHHYLTLRPQECDSDTRDEIRNFLRAQVKHINSLDLSMNQLLTGKETQSLAQNFRFLQILRLPEYGQNMHNKELIEGLLQSVLHKKLKIVTLGIQDVQILSSPIFKEVLEKIPLRGLELYNMKLTDKHLLEMSPYLKSLRYLNFENCNQLVGTGVLELVQGAPKLSILMLNRCLNISEENHLKIAQTGTNEKRNSLQYLSLYSLGPNLTDRAIKAYVLGNRSIAGLDLGKNEFENATLHYSLPLLTDSLETLNLIGCKILLSDLDLIKRNDEDKDKPLLRTSPTFTAQEKRKYSDSEVMNERTLLALVKKLSKLKHIGFDESISYLLPSDRNSKDKSKRESFASIFGDLPRLESVAVGKKFAQDLSQVAIENIAPKLRIITAVDYTEIENLKWNIVGNRTSFEINQEQGHKISHLHNLHRHSFLMVALRDLKDPILSEKELKRLYG